MVFQIHFDVYITYNFLAMDVNLDFFCSFDVSKASKLIEVSSKGISSVIQGFISRADEASSFDDIVSLVECWSCKILINRMNLELFEGVNWSYCMLPNIANNIIKTLSLKVIDRIRTHPKLHVNVANLLIIPICLILFEEISHCIVLIFCRKSEISACFEWFPFAKRPSFEVIDLSWPIPRHVDLLRDCSQFIMIVNFSPKERVFRFDWHDPFLTLSSPILWFMITIIKNKF